MNQISVFCIPGPWADRSDFIKSIITITKGEYLFAGNLLANANRKEHFELDFCEADPNMVEAFRYAGQGKIREETLRTITEHKSVVYLLSPLHILEEKEKLRRFLDVLKLAGGFAVKIESSGIAHDWETWTECITSDLPFDLYRAFTLLIGDTDSFYSCGMHHFNLPDVEVPSNRGVEHGAELINQFNLYQFIEEPNLQHGNTFSLSEEAPRYRLAEVKDTRHTSDELFHNSRGLWKLSEVEPVAGGNG